MANPGKRVPVSLRQAFLEKMLEDARNGTRRSHAEYRDMFGGDAGVDEEFDVISQLLRRSSMSDDDLAHPVDSAATELAAGTAIGPYRITSLLGRGAQGVVYLAFDEALDLTVAIKLLHVRAPFDQLARHRFEHEGRLLARVDHPNVCHVLGSGVSEHGPYIAMRYISGQSLATALDRRDVADRPRDAAQRELRRTLLRCASLARGLHEAHRAGVLHRDVKPSNVILEDDQSPVLVDFGLASDISGNLTALTLSGDRFGTVGYMSPEQSGLLAGQTEPPGPRSDVFSLGVVVYEWVCGHRPFAGTRIHDYEQALRTAKVRNPRHWHRAATRDLAVVLRRALSFDPRDRFATAADFADALERLANDQSSGVSALSLPRRIRRWAARNPATATFTAALFAVLIAGLTASTIAWWQEAEARKEARWQAHRNGITGAQASILGGALAQARRQLQDCPAELRGWEYRYLARRIDATAPEIVLPQPATALAPLTDGRFVSGDAAGAVWLVAADGTRRTELCRLPYEVEQIWSDPVSERWIAGSRPGHPAAFAAGIAGRVTAEHELAEPAVLTAEPGCRSLLVATDDGIDRWNAATNVIAPWGPRGSPVPAAIAISPDGRFLARWVSRRSGDTIEVYATEEDRAQPSWTDDVAARRARSITFSTDSARLIVTSSSGSRTHFDCWRSEEHVLLAAADVEGTVAMQGGPIAFEDGCVALGSDGVLRRYDTKFELVDRVQAHRSTGTSCHFVEATHQLVTFGDGDSVRIWPRTAGGNVTRLPIGSDWSVRSLSFDPTGTRISIATHRNSILVWSLDEPAPRAWSTPPGEVTSYSADGRELVYRNPDFGGGRLRFDAGGTAEQQPLAFPPAALIDRRHPERAVLASDVDGRIALAYVDGDDSATRTDLGVVSARPTLMAVTAGGSRIILVVPDGDASLVLEARVGSPGWRRRLRSDAPITALSLSPSDRQLAIGDSAGRVTLLDRDHGTVVGRIAASSVAISDIAFFHGDDRIAVAAGRVVHICNRRIGTPLLSLQPLSRAITALAVSATDDLAAGHAGQVVVWTTGTPPTASDRNDKQWRDAAAIVRRAMLRDGFALAAIDSVAADSAARPFVERVAHHAATTSSLRFSNFGSYGALSTPLLPPEVYREAARDVALRRQYGTTSQLDCAHALAQLRLAPPRDAIAALRKPNQFKPIVMAMAIAVARGGQVDEAAHLVRTAPNSGETPLEIEAHALTGSSALRRAWLDLEARVASHPGAHALELIPGDAPPELRAAVEAAMPAPDHLATLTWHLARSPGRDRDTYLAAEALTRLALARQDCARNRVIEAVCLLRLGETERALQMLLAEYRTAGPERCGPRIHAFLALAFLARNDRWSALRHRAYLSILAHAKHCPRMVSAQILLQMVDDALQ